MPDYDAADGAGCRANGTLYYRRKILYSSFLPEMVMESGIFSFTVYCGSLMRSSYSSMRYGISPLSRTWNIMKIIAIVKKAAIVRNVGFKAFDGSNCLPT